MRIPLDGRVLVITGGGTGIGAATARVAAGARMSVCVVGRRPEPLQDVVDSITATGGQAVAIVADVTDPSSSVRILDEVETRLGFPWAVFANAGRGLDRTGHETSPEELREIFDVNFFSTHAMLAEAARRMVDRSEGGHLLACASCLSRFSVPGHAAYSATKASQDMLCQSMRIELLPHRIFVSSVHPITTTTEFFETAARHSGSGPSRVLDDTPRLFHQTPERVGRAIIRCLRRPRPEVWTSQLVRLAAVARLAWPRLFDRRLVRMTHRGD